MNVAGEIRRQVARGLSWVSGGMLGADAAYRGATVDRVNRKWQPKQHSADAALVQGWSTMNARLRDLGRNEPWTRAARNKLTRRTIGRGITTKSAIPEREDLNRESDRLFTHWCQFEADHSGRLTWHQMQRQMMNELLEAGEVLLVECADPSPDRSVPLCYQVVEAEQIDTSHHDTHPDADGHRTIRGVEFDERNRPVAYWLFSEHPYGLAPQRGVISERVLAERITHLFNQERPSQSRGASHFAAVMQTCHDMDWLLGNELSKSYTQSLFTVAIKRAQGGGTGVGLGSDDLDEADRDKPLEQLGRAIIGTIGEKDAIEMIESKHGSANLDAFFKLLLLQTAAGLGQSYIGLTGDYSATNFSSSRAAGNDDYDQIEILQDDFAFKPVLLVRRAFTRQAAAMGLLPKVSAATFAARPETFMVFTVHVPGRKQVDVTAETQAAIMRILFGLSTWRDECAKLGVDAAEIREQLEREWADLDNKGMKIDLNRFAMAMGSVIASQKPGADEDTSSGRRPAEEKRAA